MYGFKIGIIVDLIEYCCKYDCYLECCVEVLFESEYGDGFKMVIFCNVLDNSEYIVIVYGVIEFDSMIMVWVYCIDVLVDIFGEKGL